MKEFVLLSVLLGIYACMDLKKKGLPVWSLIFGMGSVMLLCFVDSRFTGVYSVSGLAAGLFVILVSVLTRGQIGLADGVVFCITGLCLDFWQNMALLLVSLFLLSVPAAAFFLQQKKEKELPFLPGVFLGFLILWVGGGFSV